MKSKKFFISLIATSFIITACSTSSNPPKSKSVSDIKTTSINSEEIVNKTLAAFDKVKSFEISGEEDSYFADSTQPVPEDYSYEVEQTIILSPEYANKKTLTSNENKIQHFIEKDGIFYRYYYPKNIYSGSWAKGVMTQSFVDGRISEIKEFHKLKQMINQDGFNIKESDNTYEITFNPQDLEKWKSIFLKTDTGLDIDKSSIKNFKFKLIVDKATFLPVKRDVDYTIIRHLTTTNIPLTSYLKEDVTYKNYNSAKDFEVPSEAKNASGVINIS